MSFKKNDFLQYMFEEFPTVYNNTHSRELLENSVDYCMETNANNEGRFIEELEKIVPEITHNEVTKWFDNTPRPKVKITSLDSLKEHIEETGWIVDECEYTNEVGWEISQFTPAGEDFRFYVSHDNDVLKAVSKIKDYCEYFDKQAHLEMHLEAKILRGVSGMPSIQELVEDADCIENMLCELKDFCNNLDLEIKNDKEIEME